MDWSALATTNFESANVEYRLDNSAILQAIGSDKPITLIFGALSSNQRYSLNELADIGSARIEAGLELALMPNVEAMTEGKAAIMNLLGLGGDKDIHPDLAREILEVHGAIVEPKGIPQAAIGKIANKFPNVFEGMKTAKNRAILIGSQLKKKEQ